MSEKKDYLSQLASDIKKPESFKEEKFETVEKASINLNPKFIIGGLVAIIALGVAAYFMFFAPSITMPDFVGSTSSDVAAWVKQEGIDPAGIIIKEEYNFDNDKDIIVSQSIDANKKVSTDAKVTFVASLGADPDELVPFLEDVLSKNRSDVQAWIDENKLDGVKITQEYNENTPENQVISVDMNGLDASEFRRGSNVTFKISRGSQPAGTITVTDFIKKPLSDVETFAKNNKIELEVSEVYSDDVDSGLVITQSIESGKTMKQEETLSVTVSKGEAVTVPNFVGYTEEMLAAWTANPDNNITIIKHERYDQESLGDVISQSISAGKQVDQGSVIELTVSLYMPILQTNSRQWLGKDYMELADWADGVNSKGANIHVGAWKNGGEAVKSDEYPTPGQIIEYSCLDSDGEELSTGCERPLPLDGKISFLISAGPETDEGSTSTPVVKITVPDTSNDYAMFKGICQANAITVVEVVEELDTPSTSFQVFKQDGTTELKQGDEIESGSTIIVKIQKKTTAIS